MEEKKMQELNPKEMETVNGGAIPPVPTCSPEPDDPVDLPVRDPVPPLIFGTLNS